jgi:hypothetical protein
MFRFTIRDVLWLMVVVAMGVKWWNDDRIKEARHKALEREMLAEIESIYDENRSLRQKIPTRLSLPANQPPFQRWPSMTAEERAALRAKLNH